MKVKGLDKVIMYHLGSLFDAANENASNVQPFHRQLLGLPACTEEAVHAFAAKEVSKRLAELEVKDPVGYKTMGFAKFEDADSFALAVPGTKAFMLTAEKRERVLPGISVRNAVVKRMAALQAKEIEGWTPTRKDWAEMKDEVEAEMLATAPIRPTRYSVVVSVPYVFVFTSSMKTAEDIHGVIRKAFGTWPV